MIADTQVLARLSKILSPGEIPVVVNKLVRAPLTWECLHRPAVLAATNLISPDILLPSPLAFQAAGIHANDLDALLAEKNSPAEWNEILVGNRNPQSIEEAAQFALHILKAAQQVSWESETAEVVLDNPSLWHEPLLIAWPHLPEGHRLVDVLAESSSARSAALICDCLVVNHSLDQAAQILSRLPQDTLADLLVRMKERQEDDLLSAVLSIISSEEKDSPLIHDQKGITGMAVRHAAGEILSKSWTEMDSTLEDGFRSLSTLQARIADELAVQAAGQGNSETEIERRKQALQVEPTPLRRALLAHSLNDNGQFNQALDAISTGCESVEECIASGTSHLSLGHEKQADLLFSQAVEHLPDMVGDIHTWFSILIQSLRTMGNRRLSLNASEKYSKLIPGRAQVHVLFAEELLASGDPRSAAEEAQIGLALSPSSVTARRILAKSLEEAGNWTGALPQWEEICTADPSARLQLASCSLEAGLIDLARETLDNLLQEEPDNIKASALQCRLIAMSGDYENAVANLHDLLDTHPHCAKIWQTLFETQSDVASDEEVEGTLSRAVQSAVDAPLLLNTYASWLSGKGRISEAVGFAERSFRLDPNEPGSAALYAQLLRKTADPKASVVLQKAHELQPRSPSILLDLAESAETGDARANAAELLVDLPLSIEPGQNLTAGRILFQSGSDKEKLARAVLHLERASEFEETSLLATFWLAESLLASGMLQEAIQQYRAFLADPRHGSDHRLMKQVFLKLANAAASADDTILSLTTLENASEVLADDVDVLLPLTRAYLAAGLYQQSMDTALQALAIDEKHLEARRLLLDASLEAGSYETAESTIKDMHRLHPECPETWLGAASLRYVQENIPEVRRCVAAALYFGRHRTDILVESARILLSAGLQDSASRILSYGINTLPVDKEQLRILAEASESSSDFQSAQKAWRRYTQQAPQDPRGFLRAVQALWKLERRAAAMELLHQAKDRFPDNSVFPLQLAQYQLAGDQLAEARQSYRNALDISPDDNATILDTAAGFIQMNELTDAEALLKHVLNTDENSQEALFLLVECLLLQGENQQAFELVEKCSPDESGHAVEPAWWFSAAAAAAARVKEYETAHKAFALAHARKLHTEKDFIWLSRAARLLGFHDISMQVFSELDENTSSITNTLKNEILEAEIEALEADAVLREIFSVSRHAVQPSSFNLPLLQEETLPEHSAADIDKTVPDPLTTRLRIVELNLTKDLHEYLEAIPEDAQTSGMLTSLAVMHLRKGRPEQALDLLRRVHQEGPLHDWHQILIAAALVAHNQPELARKTIKSLRINPTQQPLLDYLVGKSWLLENDMERFCQTMSDAVSSWNNEPLWQFELGRAYARLQDTASALPHLQQSVLLDPGNTEAFQLLGTIMEMDGLTAEAAAIYEQAVQTNPSNTELLVHAGRLALELDQPQKSARWFERAESLGANSVAFHLGRARTSAASGSYGDASASIQTVLENDPQNADALLLMGEIRRKEGRPAEALAAIEKASEILPHSLSLLIERIRLQIETGKHDTALQALHELLEEDSENENLWALTSEAYQAAGHTEEAIEALARAARLAPRNHAYRTSLGQLAFELGQLDRALDELDTAAELNPESSAIHLLRGDIFAARRQHNQALEAYQKAITLDPDQSSPHFKAGLILKQMKAYPEAGLMLKQAASLNPTDPDIMHQLAAVRALELVHGQILQPVVES